MLIIRVITTIFVAWITLAISIATKPSVVKKTIATTRISITNATKANNETKNLVKHKKKEIETNDNINEVLTSEAKQVLCTIFDQLASGWLEYDIPPLDPYINENLQLCVENEYLHTNSTFEPLQINGLSDVDVLMLKVRNQISKIDFDLNFPNITALGSFKTSTFLDLENEMNISIKIIGDGEFNVGLENLRLYGHFKYNLLPSETVRIKNLVLLANLGKVHSEIQGSVNTIQMTKYFNHYLEKKIMQYFNEKNPIFHKLLENGLESLINADLEGGTLCNLIAWALNKIFPTTTVSPEIYGECEENNTYNISDCDNELDAERTTEAEECHK